MQVQEIMTREVRTVAPSDSIQKAAQIMKTVDCGSVPVTEGSRVVGILTDRDIVVTAVASGEDAHCPVQQCMSDTVVTIEADRDAQAAADLMADHQIRRLPVVQQGKLVGILAIADLARQHIFVSESGQALSEISEPNRHARAIH